MSTRAYLLIHVHAGREEEVLGALTSLEEVVSCDMVTGEADLIALVEAPDYQIILDALLAKVRQIDGISHTVTCLVL